jgi:hypothetical protein
MEVASSRKPRRVCATATYLNAGLWGSRFVGDCEIATNGEKVWLTGHRIPLWVTLARVFSFVAFLPVGLYTGWLLGETLLGHRGYPPYYYLASALLTFLLVTLGMWGAGIWNRQLGSFDAVVWSVGQADKPRRGGAARERSLWHFMNTAVHVDGSIQLEIPVGPNGKPRRLVLKARGVDAATLVSVLSGVYYGQTSQDPFDMSRLPHSDHWTWSRN